MDYAAQSEVIRKRIATEGCSQQSVAEAIEVSPSTVSRRVRRDPQAKSPGRPRKAVDLQTTIRVLRVIDEAAGHVSERMLEQRFPKLPRRWIRDVLGRGRQLRRKRRRQQLYRAIWPKPGTVWAMDFTALDGRQGAHALCVRDLGSTSVLYMGLVEAESAQEVMLVLVALFVAHGAPLVIKADNGPAFVEADLKRFIEQAGVMLLYSPPWTPEYNGSCEQGNGQVKRIADDLRLRDDPWAPLSDYLEPALEIMDAQLVGRGGKVLTRRELWLRRQPCSEAMREELRARYRRAERKQREVREIDARATLGHAEQASVDRHAIRDALCGMELLMIRRP